MYRTVRLNEQIRAREVRLIGEDREQLGLVPLPDALARARELGVDLVEVDPNGNPPVCRLLDYGKFKYQQAKKEHEARKHQKVTLLKEIRVRPKIDVHDMEFKIRTAERLLREGDKVKVTCRFRGREMTHMDLGRDVLNRIRERLKDISIIEKGESTEGRAMSLVLAPLPPKLPAKREKAVAKEAKEVQA
ncbi:MAG TPA: translation initiation factor IF-3 [Dehalococcoidia bacterium]|nr:translation initiation factor IF-3 [Dehalococcoidia bacterium]